MTIIMLAIAVTLFCMVAMRNGGGPVSVLGIMVAIGAAVMAGFEYGVAGMVGAGIAAGCLLLIVLAVNDRVDWIC